MYGGIVERFFNSRLIKQIIWSLCTISVYSSFVLPEIFKWKEE